MSGSFDLRLVGRVDVFGDTDRNLVTAQIVEDGRIVKTGIVRRPAALRLGLPSDFEKVWVCYLGCVCTKRFAEKCVCKAVVAASMTGQDTNVR